MLKIVSFKDEGKQESGNDGGETKIRCVKCRRLLMKYKDWFGSLEIKCPKCGYVQDVTGVTGVGGMCGFVPFMITFYQGKHLKDVPAEKLQEALADYDNNRNPCNWPLDIYRSIYEELVRREPLRDEPKVTAEYTDNVFDEERLISVINKLPPSQ